MLKVNEIFRSIQGEGIRLGCRTIFVRLTGCNLRCPFCDTQYAFDRGKDMSIDDIMEAVNRIGIEGDWVCITGGEPTIQNIDPLIKALHDQKYNVSLETNGSSVNTKIFVERVDFLTISPKPDNLDNFYISKLNLANELKFVITCKDDLEWMQDFFRGFMAITWKIPIFLQPCDNNKKVALLIMDYLRDHPHFRLGVQLHKVYGVR